MRRFGGFIITAFVLVGLVLIAKAYWPVGYYTPWEMSWVRTPAQVEVIETTTETIIETVVPVQPVRVVPKVETLTLPDPIPKVTATVLEKPVVAPTQRPILVTNLPSYGWESTEVAAILAAYDDGKFLTVKVADGKWIADLWGSPYERRWSEANMSAHLRDEHPKGVDVLVITTPDRRYTILLDGCGGIQKIAVGVKPDPQPAPRVHTPAPRTAKVVETSRPAPEGVQMICIHGCE